MHFDLFLNGHNFIKFLSFKPSWTLTWSSHQHYISYFEFGFARPLTSPSSCLLNSLSVLSLSRLYTEQGLSCGSLLPKLLYKSFCFSSLTLWEHNEHMLKCKTIRSNTNTIILYYITNSTFPLLNISMSIQYQI